MTQKLLFPRNTWNASRRRAPVHLEASPGTGPKLLEAVDVLVGEWSLVLTDAWFLESRDVRQRGHAVARWIGDAFIELHAEMEGEPV